MANGPNWHCCLFFFHSNWLWVQPSDGPRPHYAIYNLIKCNRNRKWKNTTNKSVTVLLVRRLVLSNPHMEHHFRGNLIAFFDLQHHYGKLILQLRNNTFSLLLDFFLQFQFFPVFFKFLWNCPHQQIWTNFTGKRTHLLCYVKKPFFSAWNEHKHYLRLRLMIKVNAHFLNSTNFHFEWIMMTVLRTVFLWI